MYYHLILVPFILIGTIITWRARNKENYKTVAVFQPVTTILTIAVAALSFLAPNVIPGFTVWILVGLVLSLAGDIFNINMSNDKILYAAIIVFFFAYLVYPIGITVYNGFYWQDIIVGVILLASMVCLLSYVWKHLENQWKIPGTLYKLVMIFMVSRGVSTFFGDTFSLTQAIMLSVGTAILYIADSEYAVHRFVKPFKTIYGPILYPTGQLLIALSCSYFPAA